MLHIASLVLQYLVLSHDTDIFALNTVSGPQSLFRRDLTITSRVMSYSACVLGVAIKELLIA